MRMGARPAPPVARRWRRVAAMPPQQPGVWVGIDLGGTNAKAAAISDEGIVLSSHAIPHDGDLDSEHVIRRLHQCAEAAIEEIGVAWDEVLGVGVGAPGSIEDGVVTGASNFPSWKDVPLQDSLCKLCGGRPTTLANDADAAAAAELWVGAAAAGGFEDMVFVTLGTGVGVGVILGGEVVRGATGTIEGGHHIVQAVGGRPCPCGQSGCLEAYCSATSVVKRAEEALEAHSSASSSALASCAKKDGSSSLDNKAIFDAAIGGDDLSLQIVDETAMYLAAGCLNFARIVDPAIIVFSGGATSGEAGELLLSLLNKHVDALTWTVLPTPTQFAMASAGPDAGLIGAAFGARATSQKQPPLVPKL